jgi:hypothetical protein
MVKKQKILKIISNIYIKIILLSKQLEIIIFMQNLISKKKLSKTAFLKYNLIINMLNVLKN